MRYPKFLKGNGTTGFIAPSFGCATKPYNTRFDNTIRIIKSFGFNISEGPNSRCARGIGKSNTSRACADEINDFFINDRCDVIISCGGGELMCEDLPFVDFESIKKATPKWFTGYSDNTNLTFLLPTLCDTAAIYGPCAGDYGREPWHTSIDDVFALLKGEKLEFTNYDGWEKKEPDANLFPLASYNITEPYEQHIIVPDSCEKGYREADSTFFEGRLIGGCLDVLANLTGTRFDKVADFNERYKKDGFIWFLESCELNSMSIRRALFNLNEAGWFKYVKGFLIGRPLMYTDSFAGFTPFEANVDYLKQFNVPIIYGIDLGHLPPMLPVISGGYAKVTAEGNDFRIKYELK